MPVLLRQALLLIAVFAIVTAIASVAGAKNLGTAMTFGQVAFAIVLVGLMVRGPHTSTGDEGDAGTQPRGD